MTNKKSSFCLDNARKKLGRELTSSEIGFVQFLCETKLSVDKITQEVIFWSAFTALQIELMKLGITLNSDIEKTILEMLRDGKSIETISKHITEQQNAEEQRIKLAAQTKYK